MGILPRAGGTAVQQGEYFPLPGALDKPFPINRAERMNPLVASMGWVRSGYPDGSGLILLSESDLAIGFRENDH